MAKRLNNPLAADNRVIAWCACTAALAAYSGKQADCLMGSCLAGGLTGGWSA